LHGNEKITGYGDNMPTQIKSLPSVTEGIAYVESLGYNLIYRRWPCYHFEVIDKSKRPMHNWHMTWTLAEMRHAAKYGA